MQSLGYLPASIVAGETIWIAAANATQGAEDIILTDYTPADYSLQYQFSADTPISVDAVANGSSTGWTLEVTGAQTLSWAPAAVRFAAFVTNTDTDRIFAVDGGTIEIEASPIRVSAWKAVLSAIDAAILTYAANPYGSFNVDGFNVTYRTLNDLTRLRDYASYQLQKDTANNSRRIIRTRFTL